MPVSPHFKSKHYKEWNIYFPQCYPNAYLKLQEMANFFQITASEHANLGGVGFSDLQEYNQSWVLNRMRIEIDEMPGWLNQIEVNTWVEELKGAKSTRNFTIEREGKKLVGVSSLWAIFNTERRRPDVLAINTDHIERFPELHATEKPNDRINLEVEYTEQFHYKVQFSDIDIVNHVNNTKYLEWCLNCMDPAIVLQNQIKSIDLNFMREISLGEDVLIEKAIFGNSIVFKISKQETNCFACQFELKS
ncbi:acyl-[acyl-carrier-protein] thioesterase [Faecalibacter sp. LW9]|uniref:acyl-[acyl-carrier-protein] thioesterase n=1 Tax=Faecalibacter sp. LW9 TaxID=3103144 RepID=UPI002AFDD37B|nr:acyl-ACP thioesterase domain-containing protein [Faecalibacter sp. LW9]